MIFFRRLSLAALAMATMLCPLVVAQAPAPSQTPKPSNATGQCKDGTYSTASSKSGACRGHNGVKDWYTATASTPSTPAAAAKPAPSAAPAPNAPSAQPAPATPPQAAGKPASGKGPKANLASTPAAAGGAPNLVWVNTASNVYHCYGTDFYGKTKAGAYMTEADAKVKGARGNRGATCTK